MTKRMGLGLTLTSVLCLLGACGGESKSGDEVGRDSPSEREGSADAATTEPPDLSDTDATESAETESPEEDDESELEGDEQPALSPNPAGPATTPSSSGFVPPEPILPDVPPSTPISDLDDDEFAAVCGAFLTSMEDLLENASGTCGFQGISAAEDSGATDVAEYRAACADGRQVCEDETAAAREVIGVLECGERTCSATLEQFDACRTQLIAFDALFIEPLSALPAPSCSEVTPATGASFSLLALATLLGGLAAVSDEQGGSPLDPGSPCESIEEQCPDFFALGALNPL